MCVSVIKHLLQWTRKDTGLLWLTPPCHRVSGFILNFSLQGPVSQAFCCLLWQRNEFKSLCSVAGSWSHLSNLLRPNYFFNRIHQVRFNHVDTRMTNVVSFSHLLLHLGSSVPTLRSSASQPDCTELMSLSCLEIHPLCLCSYRIWCTSCSRGWTSCTRTAWFTVTWSHRTSWSPAEDRSNWPILA